MCIIIPSPGIPFDSFIHQPVGTIKLVEKQLKVYQCRAHKTILDSQTYSDQTWEHIADKKEHLRIQCTGGKIGYFEK